MGAVSDQATLGRSVDQISPERRSWNMSRIRPYDTRPELVVRRMLHRMGYRYRLHRRDLPGKPDLVFPSRGKVLFVHGCFWHRHNCKVGNRIPKSRVNFWLAKFEYNRRRDRRNVRALNRAGWRVLTVWECQIQEQNLDYLKHRVVRFLEEL